MNERRKKRIEHRNRRRRRLYPYRLAHHPLCSKFDDHVYIIKGKKVCRGCVNMYSGFLIGLILDPILVVFLNIDFWIAFAINWGLFLFTPISIFLNLPRVIKDFSRFLLGFALVNSVIIVALALVQMIVDFKWGALAVLIITVLVYYFSRKYFTILRDKRNEDICKDCEQFYHPRCEGMGPSSDDSKPTPASDTVQVTSEA